MKVKSSDCGLRKDNKPVVMMLRDSHLPFCVLDFDGSEKQAGAEAYIQVPVAKVSKEPVGKEWHKVEVTEGQYAGMVGFYKKGIAEERPKAEPKKSEPKKSEAPKIEPQKAPEPQKVDPQQSSLLDKK